MAAPNKLPEKAIVLEALNSSRTKKEAADQLGVSQQAITEWMKTRKVKRICRYVEMTEIDTRAVTED